MKPRASTQGAATIRVTLRKPKNLPRLFVKGKKGSGFVLQSLRKDARRDPNDLCGGRVLRGREFQERKRELEARDAEERRRVRA